MGLEYQNTAPRLLSAAAEPGGADETHRPTTTSIPDPKDETEMAKSPS
jgi:hypothetical protein